MLHTNTPDLGPHNNSLNKALCMSADFVMPTAHADYFSANSARSLFRDIFPAVFFWNFVWALLLFAYEAISLR